MVSESFVLTTYPTYLILRFNVSPNKLTLCCCRLLLLMAVAGC